MKTAFQELSHGGITYTIGDNNALLVEFELKCIFIT